MIIVETVQARYLHALSRPWSQRGCPHGERWEVAAQQYPRFLVQRHMLHMGLLL